MKILAVAEKPSMSKSLMEILSGGRRSVESTGNKYIKNYVFNTMYNRRDCEVTMTSVLGHLMETDLEGCKEWRADTLDSLFFDVPMRSAVKPDMLDVEKNLKKEARSSEMLVIFTDCDREGEKIGDEVASVCRSANRNIIVKRARFSIVQKREIFQAWNTLTDLDMKMVEAVNARLELDLRIGAIYTRLQTINLKQRFRELKEGAVISYGTCQFPTLGFIVDRYNKAKNFIPEPFWHIDAMVSKGGIRTKFCWQRTRLFDHDAALFFHDLCKSARSARVAQVVSNPKSKWAPLPLTTIEMQKLASRILKMSSATVMKVAEDLYRAGIISYPRTETDVFGPTFELKPLVQAQTTHPEWGAYATTLLSEGVGPCKFRHPRAGKKNDQAHPPIHPVRAAAELRGDEKKLYEFITRRFLACCSPDAKGHGTTVAVEIGGEYFEAKGLTILERNYLNVYHPFENWSGNEIADFQTGEMVDTFTTELVQGNTSRPNYLTESDLIGIMDKSGIGTDATIHEHIKTILSREYARKEGEYFLPTVLGMSLITGYDKMDIDISLCKPALRALMEKNMDAICSGQKRREDVVREVLELYRKALGVVVEQMDVMYQSCGEHLTEIPAAERQSHNPGTRDSGKFIRNCWKCKSPMHLKTLQPKESGGSIRRVISCSGYPSCKESKWLPDVMEQVTVQENQNCPTCATGPQMMVKKVEIQFKRNYMPLHISNPLVCCLFCDDDVQTHCFATQKRGASASQAPPPRQPTQQTSLTNNTRTQISNNAAPRAPFQPLNQPRVANNFQGFDDTEDEDTPVCNCGIVCTLRTSNTAKSAGKQFYVCSKPQNDGGKCDFFLWKEDASTRMMPPVASSNLNTTRGSEVEKKMCLCGLVAAIKTSQKDNENKGKSFYTCVRSGKSCGFFEWIDGDVSTADSTARYSSAGRGGQSSSSAIVCFKCDQQGHFANACPNGPSGSSRGGGVRKKGRGSRN